MSQAESLSRRNFLKLAGAATGAGVLSLLTDPYTALAKETGWPIEKENFNIAYDDIFTPKEQEIIISSITKIRETLSGMGFNLEAFPIGRSVEITRSNNGMTQNRNRHDLIALASVDPWSICHEYATHFSPFITIAMGEGVAEMFNAKARGEWLFDVDYTEEMRTHAWNNHFIYADDTQELGFLPKADSSRRAAEMAYLFKITLGGKAAECIENECPGIWTYLGERTRRHTAGIRRNLRWQMNRDTDQSMQHQIHDDLPNKDLLFEWVSQYDSSAVDLLQSHPILFMPDGSSEVDLNK